MTLGCTLRNLRLGRLLAPLLLLVSLLAPLALPALLLQADTCGMACCKRSGVCCCRKAKAAKSRGPVLQAASRCGANCGRLPALPRLVAAIPARAALPGSTLAAAPARPGSSSRVHPSSSLPFALFQRPPPSA